MPVNILKIEETDEAETFVPGVYLPTERRIDTFDIDIFPQPEPLPPWMNYVPQALDVPGIHVRTRRTGTDRVVIREINPSVYAIVSCPHHGGDFELAGNGTVAVVDAKNTYVQGSYQRRSRITHADVPDVVTMYYRSMPSSTEHDFPFVTMEISSRRASVEPLAGYEKYAVDNWDGYNAFPITSETLTVARSILKALPKKPFGEPDCSPGADGSIGFEWLMNSGPVRKLFIDIGPGRTWKAYWRFASGHTETIPRKRVSLSTIRELNSLFERLGA